MQRHHLLPCQLLSRDCFSSLFDVLGKRGLFDDFRANGLLLPAREADALRTAMPLHRGPHRNYNDMVAHRVGQIEAGWQISGGPGKAQACNDARMRLQLLQTALRRRLLDHRRRHIALSSKDPIGQGFDFTELDAMAEIQWNGTGAVAEPSSPDQAP